MRACVCICAQLRACARVFVCVCVFSLLSLSLALVTSQYRKTQIIFRKRATNYRALLRKMTYKDKASSLSLHHDIITAISPFSLKYKNILLASNLLLLTPHRRVAHLRVCVCVCLCVCVCSLSSLYLSLSLHHNIVRPRSSFAKEPLIIGLFCGK